MKHAVYVFIGCILISCTLRAQSDLSIHFMKEMVQSAYHNPAMLPEGFHIALPSAYLDLHHSGQSLSKWIRNDNGSAVLDFNQIQVDKLDNRNFLNFRGAIEPLTLSYLKDRLSFSLSYQVQGYGLAIYDVELPELLVNGNAQYIGETVELNTFVEANLMHTYAFGVGYHLPYFAVAARVKYISGLFNLNTESGQVQVRTEEDTYQLGIRTDLSFLKSGSLLAYDGDRFSLSSDPVFQPFVTRNFGLATDFGVKLNLSDQFYINASVLDLGQIRWRSNPERWRSDRQEVITGVDLSGFLANQQLDFESIGDTIESFLDLRIGSQEYNQGLPTRIVLGLQYDINPSLTFGMLYAQEYNELEVFPTLAAELTAHFGDLFHVGTVYSTKHNSFINLGLHFLLELGPVQLFGLTDNVIDVISYKPYGNAHVRAGINLKFDELD